MPPSTLTDFKGTPESAFVAPITARYGLQHGPRQATLVDEPGQVDDRATRVQAPIRREQSQERGPEVGATVVLDPACFSISAAVPMRPRLSRSHCTSDPVTAMEPSSAQIVSLEPIL